jgi:hypothetical protein
MEFLINRDDLRDCKVVADTEPPEPAEGQALLEVDSFGLTANNVTYAVLGDGMSYWKFFPGPDGWGRMPVWGFSVVADANGTGLEDGQRIYGYMPPSSHMLVNPVRVDERGFNDGAPHRADLPSVYQGYRLTEGDEAYIEGKEAEQMLFWPLFYTSFMLDDFLADEDFFGAETIVVGSASSKTALIAAYMLAQREGTEVIALTSPGNREFVEGTGVYASTLGYDEIVELPRRRSVYVDMSGDGEVRAKVHEHLGDSLAHDCAVGASHWEQLGAGFGGSPGELPGPPPQVFFAPTRISKRIKDWGPAEVNERVVAAWKPFVEWSGGWLRVERREGADAVKETYLEVLDGRIKPADGHVISLDG